MTKTILAVLLICNLGFGQTAMDWVSLPQEVNDVVWSLTPYKGELVAGGRFTSAGNQPVNKVAAWNGVSWSSLGDGVHGGYNPYVFRSIVINNELYVVGNFDSAGTVATRDIAKWDGTTWSGFGSGSNAGIYSIAFFNNEIYVGGRFDSIGGIAANHIAKWDGSSWQPLGTGINGNNVNDLYVYQNELYALGVLDSAGNIPCNYIARWNGNNWNNVSTGLDYGNSSLIQVNNKLLAGSHTTVINQNVYELVKQWDGNTWTLFSQQQQMTNVRAFLVFNNKLYFAGGLGVGAPGSTAVMLWDSLSSKWDYVGSGINNYTQAFCVFNNEMYCGGYFTKATGAYHNYIAHYSISTGIGESDWNKLPVSVFPNPGNGQLTVQYYADKRVNTSISVSDILGRNVHEERDIYFGPESNSKSVDLSRLPNGIYLVTIITEDGKSGTYKQIISH